LEWLPEPEDNKRDSPVNGSPSKCYANEWPPVHGSGAVGYHPAKEKEG